MPNTAPLDTTPLTMRALVLRAWGDTPTFEEASTPVAALGETLVRVEAAALTHLDLTIASGTFSLRPSLPFVGGVEGAGVVISSRSHRAGTRVSVRGGDIGAGRPGTWADYVAVPDAYVTPAPVELSPGLAATAFDPLTTAQVTLEEIAQLGGWPLRGVTSAADEVVVVAGAAGAVGSVVVQLALRAGARVIGLVSRPERISDVPVGAEVVTLADVDALAHLTGTRPGTLLVDTWGGPDLVARGHWVRPGGRTAVVGYVHGNDITLDLANWMFDDVALLPVNLIERTDSARRRFAGLQELLVDGALSVATQTFEVAEAADAFDLLRGGRVNGRAVLRFSGSW